MTIAIVGTGTAAQKARPPGGSATRRAAYDDIQAYKRAHANLASSVGRNSSSAAVDVSRPSIAGHSLLTTSSR